MLDVYYSFFVEKLVLRVLIIMILIRVVNNILILCINLEVLTNYLVHNNMFLTMLNVNSTLLSTNIYSTWYESTNYIVFVTYGS